MLRKLMILLMLLLFAPAATAVDSPVWSGDPVIEISACD